jgi:hypothetical protein
VAAPHRPAPDVLRPTEGTIMDADTLALDGILNEVENGLNVAARLAPAGQPAGASAEGWWQALEDAEHARAGAYTKLHAWAMASAEPDPVLTAIVTAAHHHRAEAHRAHCEVLRARGSVLELGAEDLVREPRPRPGEVAQPVRHRDGAGV